ncbi:MAG: hypothetical protein JW862_08495 [Anaerolineales bacterium]|nr:hypothetical protein [Anaerolineales bacterium]
MQTRLPLKLALPILLATNLACRPVLTVGWQEILILVIVVAILLGPALFRLYRRMAEFQDWKTNRQKKNDPD